MKIRLIFILIAIFMITGLLIFIKFGNIGFEIFPKRDFLSIGNQNLKIKILVDKLDTPWALDFLPSNEIIFTERKGTVSLFNEKTLEIKEIGKIKVSEVSESGLLGLAIDPEFEENKYIYLYYTSLNSYNKVSRFVLNEELEEEFVLLENIPSARFHDGGRLKFGPDGKLYVTTGDATQPLDAQDINSLSGKILRLNKDGSIPEDNPFDNFIYSYGHRNPQGIDWDDNGQMYSSEHGPTRNDEVNLIVKGGNYGWPNVQCNVKSDEYENPIRCFEELTIAPSSISYHKGNLYVGGLRGNQVRKINIDNEGNIENEEILLNDMGRIRDVVSNDGYLYIATSNKDGRGKVKSGDDKIVRIKL